MEEKHNFAKNILKIDNSESLPKAGHSKRYDPYKRPEKLVEEKHKQDLENEHRSILSDLSHCFTDEVNNEMAKREHESEHLFDRYEVLFPPNDSDNNEGSVTCPVSNNKYETKSVCIEKSLNDQTVDHSMINISYCDATGKNDLFNESLNTSFSFLNNMHNKVLEKSIINENSTVTELSQINKSSQYRNEVLDSFNLCETTICQLNEDIFNNEMKESFIPNDSLFINDSVIEQNVSDTLKNEKLIQSDVPNNLSELFEGDIEFNEGCNLTDYVFTSSKSTPTLMKKLKTPLSPEHLKGDFYGLPDLAKSLIFQYKGINKLYDWQNECLQLTAVKNRENLIYALPTSGGKTLVAEILMLREVICRKKNVLFILPFVSIVQEKVWGLSPFAVGLDFLVEEYAAGKGTFPPKKRKNRRTIYIATIEKGSSLISNLLENKRLSELGLIVIDELHLIGEPSRGYNLEVLTTNVLHSGEDIQIVGMSATIGNIEDLAKFLNAKVYTKDFRPVELKEFLKLNGDIFQINYNANSENEKISLCRKVDYGYSTQIEKIDPDHLGGLVMEVIPNGSCLIFCPTKKNCENVAVLLCKVIFRKLLEYRVEEKEILIKALKAEGGAEDGLLQLLPWGVAYHHAGLATEERRLIEDAFRSGVLNVLCCTSTLAAGINLPAQRVILRAPMIGKNFLTLSTYKQMVGRAGRAGFGGHGDSILICPPHLVDKVKVLINSVMDNVMSSLHLNEGLNIQSLILGAIALKISNSRKTLRLLVNSTLLSVQAETLNIDVKQLLDQTIESLLKMRAISTKNKISVKDDIDGICCNLNISQHTRKSLNNMSDEVDTKNFGKQIRVTNETEFVVSRLGKAAIKASIDLQRAHILYGDLRIAQNNLVIIGNLHLLYLVTPYDLSENIKPNLMHYYNIYSNLDYAGNQTAKTIGITEAVAIQMARGKLPKSISERVINRFYVTLMLQDLWNQSSLQVVSDKFQINKGMVQNMMVGTATFSSSVLRFCEELEEFWSFKSLLLHFNQRLSHFCTLELVPLMELPNVKKARAMQLYKAGYKTLQAIAQAKPNDLIQSIEYMNRNVANQLIAAAKLQLLEKVENLREEVEEVMIGLEIKTS